MNQQLNSDINFSRWWILKLMAAPEIDSAQLEWMEAILKDLELQRSKWELTGYDNGGNRNSFLAHQICQN